jgi:hypothetical protein
MSVNYKKKIIMKNFIASDEKKRTIWSNKISALEENRRTLVFMMML